MAHTCYVMCCQAAYSGLVKDGRGWVRVAPGSVVPWMLWIMIAVVAATVFTSARIAATPKPTRISQVSQASTVPGATLVDDHALERLRSTPSPTPPPTQAPAPPVLATAPPVPPKPPPPPPHTIVLPVPFTPGAPTGDWTRDQESCEEATLVMYHHYLTGDRSATIPAQQAENEITAMRQAEVAMWGVEPDLSMQKLGELASSYYKHHFQVLPATVDAIGAQLWAGHPVVVPATTGMLRRQNSHFNPNHSLYHVLMLKGFTASDAVANDVGVTLGRGWIYTWPLVFQAVDDANSRIPQGRVFLVLT